MPSKFLEELSEDYKKLFEAEIGYDVIIYVGEEPNVKEIHAHSNILCARSQYFRAAFFNEWAKKEGKFIFRKQNIKPHLFDIILSLLKWCFAQQNVMNDPTKWSKDDITKIERSLHRFIPLIRFYDIEPTEFFYKVHCYRDILPQDLIHDLLEYHIVPNKKIKANKPPSRKPNLKFKLDSNLIKSNLVPLFASWIDKKESPYYDKKDIPYEFKLLYRSSRDGFDTKSFHKNCDNKGATICVAKIQDSTKLIGGYNPLDWSGNDWKNTKDSSAVYCGAHHGPQMGDLYCGSSNNWYYYGGVDYYPNLDIPNNVTIKDYEVFQVIKK
ncbi:BTB/POZ domain-containing protein [Rhizophagus clarus]|uniref:BTB/POZ domain-containing protein n=1 Tax=Rhizophagus clarus TaxID=94130 RepID=A0A8H3QD55_9GLOM|nr:BTB/POZ domain-containing protein [Rhizophagus clarus]